MLLDKHFLKMKIFGRLKCTLVSLNEFVVFCVNGFLHVSHCILFNFSNLLLIFFPSMFNVLFSEYVFSILLTEIVRTIFISLLI